MISTLTVFKVGFNWIRYFTALGELKQEAHSEFKAYLGYTVNLRASLSGP